MSGGVREQRDQRLLHKGRVHRNRGQIFSNADFHGVVFQAGERDCFAQQIAGIAPFAHRLEKPRLQTRGIEQMIDRASETSHGLLQLRAIRFRLLQDGSHRREWRLQFMRNRIKKRFLKFLRLPRDLRGAAFFQGALLVYEERELRGKRVEQFSLLDCGRGGKPDGEHAFGMVPSHKRKVQPVGIRKSVGRFPGGLLFLKRPGGDAFVLYRGSEGAGRMLGETALVA